MGVNLMSVIWDVDPILIHFGNGGIRWYGIMWALGIMACYRLQVKIYQRENCPKDWPEKIFTWMVLGVIIGARVGHCLFYEWHWTTNPIQLFTWTLHYRNPYIEHPLDIIKVWEGGLSSHGGAIGLIVAAYYLNKKHFSKVPKYATDLIWIFDRLVIGVCITATCIRFGNLMNSEIYGVPTNLPWGFIFVRDGQNLPCHPTQIYEMLYCILTFIITYIMYQKGCLERRGLIFGSFLIIVFVARFFIEFIKNDQELFEQHLFLNMGQLLSIPLIIWGVILIVNSCKKSWSNK